MKWEKLMEFLQRLQDAEMEYELKHSRDDAVSVWVDAVTEKWEVAPYSSWIASAGWSDRG